MWTTAVMDRPLLSSSMVFSIELFAIIGAHAIAAQYTQCLDQTSIHTLMCYVQRGPEKMEKCQLFLYVLINYSIQLDTFVPDSIPVILVYYTNG